MPAASPLELRPRIPFATHPGGHPCLSERFLFELPASLLHMWKAACPQVTYSLSCVSHTCEVDAPDAISPSTPRLAGNFFPQASSRRCERHHASLVCVSFNMASMYVLATHSLVGLFVIVFNNRKLCTCLNYVLLICGVK